MNFLEITDENDAVEQFAEEMAMADWSEEEYEFIMKACDFATLAHSGACRKGKIVPYIVHPMEAAMIVSDIMRDKEMVAAALLHDVVEDTEFTIQEIRERFGDRVARLVHAETEDKMRHLSAEASWKMRKEQAIANLQEETREEKMITLGDKLSNIRALAFDKKTKGDTMWEVFHQKDPREQEWYYRSIDAGLQELRETAAWQEYHALCEQVFS